MPDNTGENLETLGFAIEPIFFSDAEVTAILAAIDRVDPADPAFRRTNDLFAIRQFLKMVPAVQPLIFTPKLRTFIAETFGPDYFVVKSIYFDKPPASNWFVAWHRDLTISVDRKVDLPGFGPWTIKGDQFGVQPPVGILEGMYTLRIHLDDTDETNGALRVLPGSHRRGVERFSPELQTSQAESVCRVPRGGMMVMRPLLQHASSRSTTGSRRRVIHVELCNAELPRGLNWAERIPRLEYRI